ncbi:MAG: hypothetical protein KDK36_19695 [Leptospiraceae bacterium]|nr:hypothetical protein [Leptospiraceae bacterium]
MKIFNVLTLLFLLNCASKSIYEYPSYTINGYYAGRASDSAIEKGSTLMKQSTCCSAAEISAKYNVLKNKGEFIMSGNSDDKSFLIEGNGSIRGTEYRCVDRKNQFEECICIADIPNNKNPQVDKEIKKSDSTGWISPNTYRVKTNASASERAISKDSRSMKENSCVEAAYTSGISEMLFGLRDELKINSPSIKIKARLPFLYMKSCRSEDNFSTCSCDLAFHEIGLKDRLINELSKKN